MPILSSVALWIILMTESDATTYGSVDILETTVFQYINQILVELMIIHHQRDIQGKTQKSLKSKRNKQKSYMPTQITWVNYGVDNKHLPEGFACNIINLILSCKQT